MLSEPCAAVPADDLKIGEVLAQVEADEIPSALREAAREIVILGDTIAQNLNSPELLHELIEELDRQIDVIWAAAAREV